MPNTITDEDGILNVTFDGSTDYDYESYINIEGMLFIPTSTDDVITVRNKSTTGQIICKLKFADAYDHKFLVFPSETNHKPLRPVVKGDEVTSGVIMILFYRHNLRD